MPCLRWPKRILRVWGMLKCWIATTANALVNLRLRVAGVSLLNSASQAQAQALRDARALGLNALHSPAPLRKAMMRLGLQTGAAYST